MDREEVVFGRGREGDHGADALGREGVSRRGVELDAHPVGVVGGGFWGDEVVAEVGHRLLVVEEHGVHVAVVVGIETDQSSSLCDIVDVAVFSGFGEAGGVAVVEEECCGVVPETAGSESVVLEDVFVSVVVEVVDERAPSPVSEVSACGRSLIVEGAVGVLDEEDIATDWWVVVTDVGCVEIEFEVVVDVGDVDPHAVDGFDASGFGGGVGEGAVLVVSVVA